MSPFEQFSAEMELVSQLYQKSRLARLLCRLEYWRRRYWTNETFPFKWVEGEGRPVGDPMDIYHLTLHDMFEHEARGQLTAEVLLKGRRVNAFSVGPFERMDEMWGKYTIQPRWV